jgi:hypothetical protein
LKIETKVAELPRREIVASQICIPSSEKEIEKQKNLFFGVKFDAIPR